MLGMIIKDIYIAKQYCKSILIVMVLYLFIQFAAPGSNFLQVMPVFFGAMIILSVCAYDDQAGWEVFALTMPVTRKGLAASKYLSALLAIVVSSILSIAIGGLLAIFDSKVEFKESFLITWCMMGFALIWDSVLLPLVIKMGVEKARIYMFLVIGVTFIIFYLFTKFADGSIFTDQVMEALLGIVPIFSLLVFGGSYLVTKRIYEKKQI